MTDEEKRQEMTDEEYRAAMKRLTQNGFFRANGRIDVEPEPVQEMVDVMPDPEPLSPNTTREPDPDRPAVSDVPTGLKHDGEKVPMQLIDPEALLELAKVLGFGANKYAPENWRKGIAYTRIIGAIMRHTNAIHRGELLDPETGLLHSAHIMCEAMFLTSYMKQPVRYLDFDDIKPSAVYIATDEDSK